MVASPLFVYRPLPWTPPPPEDHDALLLTSAAAVRLAGPALDLYRSLPVQAVGTATAQAARTAGFIDVTAGATDARAALAALATGGATRILHLGARHHIGATHAGLRIDHVPVYVADAVAALPADAAAAIDTGATVLLHSPRAARTFEHHLAASERKAANVRIACFSPAVADAAGPGWRNVAVARSPTDEALFAAAAGLCDQDSDRPVEPR